jgi:TolB protein
LSPDGEYEAGVQTGERGLNIYVTQLSSGVSWAVTYHRAVSYDPAWSPAGDWIAYVSQEFGHDDIFRVNPQGAEKQRLTFNDWEWDKHPTYSPDGSQIVFWSNRESGRRQLWIMNADGSDQRVLLRSEFNDWDPVWIR